MPAVPSSPTPDEDERLIAEASAPPTLAEAQDTLAFWEKRLAGLHFYERAGRREAEAAVARAKQQVRAAERATYGPSALEELMHALGIRRLPGRELLSVAKKALILVTVLVVALVVATVAFWSDIYPVLRDLSQLRGG
ncbi:MAG TPA: hypothetical protein VIX82_05850 [Solirubrobacteraceae bacterium]